MPVSLVGRNFAGYQSDIARDQLPLGAAHRMKDWIPQLDAPLRGRGGWEFSTLNLGTVQDVDQVIAVGWMPFSYDPHLIVIGMSATSGGKVFKDQYADGAHGEFVGSIGVSSGIPFWHRTMGILPPAIQNLAVPQKYYDSAVGAQDYHVANLGGTPPRAAVGASWGDYVLLANGSLEDLVWSHANRIWVSAVGDPETWDVGNAFFDMPKEIARIVPMRGFIVVFGFEDVWALVGDTPPPGGNWSKRDLFAGVGCMSGSTVALWRDQVLWANGRGVYISDGTTFNDLTKRGGISRRWQELVSDFQHNWTSAAGVYQNNYVIVVHDGAGNFITGHICDLEREAWYEITNLPAAMFASRPSFKGGSFLGVDGHEDLFFGHRNLPYAARMAPVWSPGDVNAYDGDGTAVLPQLETPFYKLGYPGKKQFRKARFTYDLREDGEQPYLQVEAATSPEEAAPYSLLSDTLPVTTSETRRSVSIRKRSNGVALRVTQVGASADTRLGEVEIEANAFEDVR